MAMSRSPVIFAGQSGYWFEDEVIDSSNGLYTITAAAFDGVGNVIADVTKLKAGGARDVGYGGFGSVVPQQPLRARVTAGSRSIRKADSSWP